MWEGEAVEVKVSYFNDCVLLSDTEPPEEFCERVSRSTDAYISSHLCMGHGKKQRQRIKVLNAAVLKVMLMKVKVAVEKQNSVLVWIDSEDKASMI